MNLFTLRNFFILLSCVFLGIRADAQIVGSNCFLQGCYVEVGISDCGVYGTNVYPPAAGGPIGPYHPKPGGFTNWFGFVADAGKDGWGTGSPNFCGDYFVPGSPVEGWQVQHGANVYTNTDVGCATYNIPGSVTDYEDTGGIVSAVWEGTISALNLSITQKTIFPQGALFFLTSVTMCNTGGTDLTDVYYKRNVDPDQDEPWSGDYTTDNTIISNPPANDTALVTAQGLEFGCFLGIGAIDARAKVSHGNFSTTAGTPLQSYTGTGGYITSGETVADEAIQITFKVDIPAGECTTINFAHVLNPSDLAEALQATLTGSIGVLADSIEIDTTGIVEKCKKDTVRLDIEFGTDYSWTWTPSAGLSTDTGTTVYAYPDTTTTYTATGIGACSTLTKTITIAVDNPTGLANAGPDKFLCEGDSVQLDGSGGVTYTWLPPTYLSDPTDSTPIVEAPATNMFYSLVITDALGCPDTDQMQVTLYPNPVIDAGPDQIMVLGGFAQILASGGVSYVWSPGATLSDSVIADPFTYPKDTTMYYVTGTDINGCKGFDSVTVIVLGLTNIVSPNAFTPNGDGINDYYKPVLVGAGELDGYMIYDRWGKLMYKTEDVRDQGWDGTLAGKQQEIGTYIVYIWGKDGYAKPVSRNATLILMR